MYKVVGLVQVEVDADDAAEALELATSSTANWRDWNFLDSPAGFIIEEIND